MIGARNSGAELDSPSRSITVGSIGYFSKILLSFSGNGCL